MHESFHEGNFHKLCDQLCTRDSTFRRIIEAHGYPPLWSRKPGFETLIQIILEQQVSLASAKAALDQLKKRIGTITPRKLLTLNDTELRACYFSRQKTWYARELAQAIVSGKINFKKLNHSDEEVIRKTLKAIKGIGDWTTDVYLLMALHRTDIFPVGDLAMMNSLKKLKNLPPQTSKETVLELAEAWRPYRSLAAMMFWHQYIKERNIRL